jgi:hypothetical protein
MADLAGRYPIATTDGIAIPNDTIRPGVFTGLLSQHQPQQNLHWPETIRPLFFSLMLIALSNSVELLLSHLLEHFLQMACSFQKKQL